MCTAIIIDDLQKRAATGDELAKVLAANWEYPVEMMFATPACTLVSRLNSFKDFPIMHPDVAALAGEREVTGEEEHSHPSVFLKHVAAHFAKE